MSDIYIVYASQSREMTEALAEALSKKWDVWWDDKIVGSYPAAIEQAMDETSCVIAVWSDAAHASANVHDELVMARRRDIKIIAAKVEPCEAPYGFGTLSMVDLTTWSGDTEHDGFRQLLRRIETVVPPRGRSVRVPSCFAERIPLPAMFMSVSSHETQLTPLEAVKALRLFRAPIMLISAYDLVGPRLDKQIFNQLARFRKQGGVVLLDSGNYEASRLGDSAWSPRDLGEALANAPHDMAFFFDVMAPLKDPARSAKQILKALDRDRRGTAAPVMPIVHAPKQRVGYDLSMLPSVVSLVARSAQSPLIAVPERELGAGLVERGRTVQKIRRALDSLPFYQPLHILGTGNPWSIAVFAAAGADSFDGLEWCRMAVDVETMRLNHFQHFDFFTYQTRVAASPVTTAALDDESVKFAGKVAFHNLDFFHKFAADLQQAVERGSVEAFVTGILGRSNTIQLRAQLPDIFP
jgi:queuine/archaeosine tRNA-ribosyltransferase